MLYNKNNKPKKLINSKEILINMFIPNKILIIKKISLIHKMPRVFKMRVEIKLQDHITIRNRKITINSKLSNNKWANIFKILIKWIFKTKIKLKNKMFNRLHPKKNKSLIYIFSWPVIWPKKRKWKNNKTALHKIKKRAVFKYS